MDILVKINKQEQLKGKFESIVGDVDQRKDLDPSLLTPTLCQGFDT